MFGDGTVGMSGPNVEIDRTKQDTNKPRHMLVDGYKLLESFGYVT